MRLALSALVVFAVVYIATAQETGENQVYNYYPYYGPNARLFFTSTTTTTSVTTSTSTIICTSSVFASPLGASFVALAGKACAGRRRRGIQFDDDHNDQFSISPSVVQRVEATASPIIREARAADPQYLMMPPFGYSYYPQEIQPGFYGPVSLPYYGPYAQPVAGNRIFLSTILNAVLPTFLKQTATVTATSTAFTVVTSTSVPTCTPIPAALQCV